MEGETQPPPAAAAISISKVLDDDDLLNEILLRVGFPTTLVRAALVCKRWLGHASEPGFLGRFREIHPPRLLGFYIKDWLKETFVPMQPQHPELAAIVRRASFGLCTRQNAYAKIKEWRNGSVFVSIYYNDSSKDSSIVHRPLFPQRGPAILPPLPRYDFKYSLCVFSQVLSKEDRGGMSYFYLYMESNEPEVTLEAKFTVRLVMLHDGIWRLRHPLTIDQRLPLPRSERKAIIVNNKIYIAAALSNIIVLDLMDSNFSTIQLPQAVEHGEIRTTMLARAHDASGVYFIHAKDFHLHIWLHKWGNWLLLDTIYLHEMCADFRNAGCTISPKDTILIMNQMVDYGDYVFLKIGGCVLYLDIKCKTLCKVYETKKDLLGDIYPFTMIWPPTFPALKYDSARNAT